MFDKSSHAYLNANITNNDSHNDKQNFDGVNKALRIVGFDEKTIDTIWNTVAAIIHLGNIKFEESDANDKCAISKDSLNNQIKTIAKILSVYESELINALTTRVIATGAKDIVTANHSTKDATYSRDAFAKVNNTPAVVWLTGKL